jgi:hypothetical protein
MMSDDDLIVFEKMWTTEQQDHALIAIGDGRYSIVQLSTNMGLIIEDNDVFNGVIQKMLSMGNRQFTIDEYKTYRQRNPINRFDADGVTL